MYRDVPVFAADGPCDVWCHGLTTCLLYVNPLFIVSASVHTCMFTCIWYIVIYQWLMFCLSYCHISNNVCFFQVNLYSIDVVWSFSIIFLLRRSHYDVIKWKNFQRYWTFVRGIHLSLGNSPLKGQWRGALVFSLIRAWINGWVNNGETGDLIRHRAYYDDTVMSQYFIFPDDVVFCWLNYLLQLLWTNQWYYKLGVTLDI